MLKAGTWFMGGVAGPATFQWIRVSAESGSRNETEPAQANPTEPFPVRVVGLAACVCEPSHVLTVCVCVCGCGCGCGFVSGCVHDFRRTSPHPTPASTRLPSRTLDVPSRSRPPPPTAMAWRR